MKKKDRQTFLFSLGLSLFLLLTSAGIVAVDFQGRRLSFGDDTPPARRVELPDGSTRLELRIFDWKQDIDVTKFDKLWKMFLDFSCIPHN